MRLATAFLCALAASDVILPAGAPAQAVAARLRDRLTARDALAAFYAARNFRPVWVTDSGPLPGAAELIDVLAAAAADGLRPEDYGPAALRRLLDGPRPPDRLAEFDVLASRAFLTFAADLARGRVSPALADTLWSSAPDPPDLMAALEWVSRSGAVTEALHAQRPPHEGYTLLRLTVGWYRAFAARGGWGTVPDGGSLARGAGGARVRRLRERLAATGDLVAAGAAMEEPFDSALEAAVRRFQVRHGLAADGVVGTETVAALNVPVEARIRQIELNLERWRWLPRDLGRRYLMVNIPAFTLDVRDDDRVVLSMPVVVGRPDWETPIVSATATQVVFAPPWNIPRSIAVQEIVPLARRDAAALARQRIHVFTDSGAQQREVSPDSVDWATVSESTFTYRLVQDPGPGNPLGGVKLVFPNRFDVAAHDTPDRALFANPLRVSSHGCVRLARAAALVIYLLQDVSPWSADSVRAAMARPEERWVTLPAPVPMHLAYWTVWVDDDGVVQFRPDVYGWDARLAEALAARQGVTAR